MGERVSEAADEDVLVEKLDLEYGVALLEEKCGEESFGGEGFKGGFWKT